MTYEEFRQEILAAAGEKYGWVMLTQEKRDTFRGKILYSVEGMVFGAALQGLVESEECSREWINDTVRQMIQTLNMLSQDSQRRRDQG